MAKKTQKTGLIRLIEIAGTKKWWLIGSMILAVTASLAQFVPYIAVYNIMIELARKAANPSLINNSLVWHWAYISLIALAIYGILLYCSNMMSHIAAFNILYEMRVALAKKLVSLPMGFFGKKSSGEIKKVMSEDVERIELFIAHHIPDITTATIFPLLTLAYLFLVDWRLAAVILLVFIAAIVLQSTMINNQRSKKTMKEYHASLAGMNTSIVEYIRGMQVVKIFNRSLDAFDRLKTDIFNFRNFSIRVTKDFSYVYTGFLTILSSTLLFIIPAGVYLLINSASYVEYIPTLLLFLILGAGIFFPLLKLMWMSSLLNQNSAGVDIIDNILNMPEIPEPSSPVKPGNSSVEFINVSFSYDESPVLKNISFRAAPGSVTALVGPSGAGKTTIGMLTARFWDITSGEILIGGVNIKDIGSEMLMNYVSFVFQDNLLFYDTIEENIRMGAKATREEVEAAAKAAQCHEFILELEKGYETLVGEGGIYLSGGEQQRIALARAILKDSPVIILDEATAFADPENEAKILESFSNLIKNKTVLVIAHRLSTITNADQILVIDEGIIKEHGVHDELLNLEKLYTKMWNTYSISKNWKLGNQKEIAVPL